MRDKKLTNTYIHHTVKCMYNDHSDENLDFIEYVTVIPD